MSRDDNLYIIVEMSLPSDDLLCRVFPRNDDFDDGTILSKMETFPNTPIDKNNELRLVTERACSASKRTQSVTQMLLDRERYMNFTAADKCGVANNFLPSDKVMVTYYDEKVFCGVYSKCGSYFVTACQDGFIRTYDVTREKLEPLRTIRARDVGWSVIDVAFSPDGKSLAYSSWSESLHISKLHIDNDEQEALPLRPDASRFAVFSVVFSADGRELIGGANDGRVYVYDRELDRRTLAIASHTDEVNSVAYADESSHIFYSGADDKLVKVWDRRMLNEASPKPVGILIGHFDGITFVDSRGDGRYLISNSKDQTIKLWDVRVLASESAVNNIRRVRRTYWDYRWMEAPRRLQKPNNRMDGDTSVMTYRGHAVLKTLIRCRFSPVETTGQRYVYTGSGDGKIVIYDILTGEPHWLYEHEGCVRDVSWHPYRQEIASSSWDHSVALWRRLDPNIVDQDEPFGLFREHGCSHGQSIPRRSERIALQRDRHG